MNLVEINNCNFGSTGNIMLGIAEVSYERGIDTYICVPKSRDNNKRRARNQIMIGNRFSRNLHWFLGSSTGFQGCFSLVSTWSFLKKLSKLKPDIVHLHNLHGCYINLPALFRYIKRHNIHVVWTLHDCWAFTGQCPHFTIVKCDKWKTGCHHCKQYKKYPSSKIDRTKTMWRLKKKWFTNVNDMAIITPSQWLADLVKESFLKEYPIQVIHNGIDLNVFKSTESDFRKRYGIEDKFVILGVAFGWDERKGLDVFMDLAQRLDERYQIVLVGTNQQIDEQLDSKIISIHRTHNQQELAAIYTVADIFLNPTREENYPTVNMEAIACGTPVITFNTGGSPEILCNETGIIIESNTVDELYCVLEQEYMDRTLKTSACLGQAYVFDRDSLFKEYVKLYEGDNNEKHS